MKQIGKLFSVMVVTPLLCAMPSALADPPAANLSPGASLTVPEQDLSGGVALSPIHAYTVDFGLNGQPAASITGDTLAWSNPWGGYTFGYQMVNVTGSGIELTGLEISGLGSSVVNASYGPFTPTSLAPEPRIPPATMQRSPDGDVVTFHWQSPDLIEPYDFSSPLNLETDFQVPATAPDQYFQQTWTIDYTSQGLAESFTATVTFAASGTAPSGVPDASESGILLIFASSVLWSFRRWMLPKPQEGLPS